MKNPFKKPVKTLIEDLENYDYLLWDLEIWDFYENNFLVYINDDSFKSKFPITHNFLLLLCIIGYVDILDGSSYINNRKEWYKSFDYIVEEHLKLNNKNIITEILAWVRLSCIRFLNELDYDKEYESISLLNARNSLIPIMKYLYSVSDEFK